MSDATTLKRTNTLSAANAPSAPPEAHQRADLKSRASNLFKLPDVAYAMVASNDPGERIVLTRAGERGLDVTDIDSASMEPAQVRVLVDQPNLLLGVTDAQQQAIVAGSALGFDVPAADPDHPSNVAGTLRTVDSSRPTERGGRSMRIFYVLAVNHDGENLMRFNTAEERGQWADKASQSGTVTHYLELDSSDAGQPLSLS